jgi:hypothetical protein
MYLLAQYLNKQTSETNTATQNMLKFPTDLSVILKRNHTSHYVLYYCINSTFIYCQKPNAVRLRPIWRHQFHYLHYTANKCT